MCFLYTKEKMNFFKITIFFFITLSCVHLNGMNYVAANILGHQLLGNDQMQQINERITGKMNEKYLRDNCEVAKQLSDEQLQGPLNVLKKFCSVITKSWDEFLLYLFQQEKLSQKEINGKVLSFTELIEKTNKSCEKECEDGVAPLVWGQITVLIKGFSYRPGKKTILPLKFLFSSEKFLAAIFAERCFDSLIYEIGHTNDERLQQADINFAKELLLNDTSLKYLQKKDSQLCFKTMLLFTIVHDFDFLENFLKKQSCWICSQEDLSTLKQIALEDDEKPLQKILSQTMFKVTN